MAHEYQKRTRRRERNNNHLSNKKKGKKERIYKERINLCAVVLFQWLWCISLSLSHQQRGISHRYGRLLGYISGERERRLKSRPLNTQSNSAAPISWCLLSTAHTQPRLVWRERSPPYRTVSKHFRENWKKRKHNHTQSDAQAGNDAPDIYILYG